ncbi:DUF72 domain-containing protein [Baaleninema simplex]|uniref:DUF72 domain-containing protein n=1 Tax=Baaleninema simplex TaxID=2862350 RepID=UPI00034B731E|nr:DUF72 domain-containing protein [Baaleninema simplex]
MDLRLGCAVWAYKGWMGEFFPPGSRNRDFLALYSRRFRTVEGNTTFYAVPDAATLDRWAQETPEGFEFCLKLPRSLSHSGLLEPQIDATREFLQQMQRLGDKLGPVFVQLPPNYSPESFEDLTAFLKADFPRVRLALEVRHRDWFAEPYAQRLDALLRELGIARVMLDTRPIYQPGNTGENDPQRHSRRRKPNLPLHPTITADFAFVRFITHPDRDANTAFLEDWANRLEHWNDRRLQVYFFVHCPVEDFSPGTARSLQNLLENREIPVSSLPWNAIDDPPVQLSLF